MLHVIGLVQGATALRIVRSKNSANFLQIGNELGEDGLLSELWEMSDGIELVEVVQIEPGLAKIKHRLNGLFLNGFDLFTVLTRMLDVLLLIFL